MSAVVEQRLTALVGKVKKVRRWLVCLSILKVAALCVVFVSIYIGLYAWLDHAVRLGTSGRIVAFALLAGGVGVLFFLLARSLLGHVSCSGAANYVEGKRCYDQQLVAAVEYHENRRGYPYSRALADQLVMQVAEATRGFRFDSTVQKWRGYAFSAVIAVGLLVTGAYVRDNYVYFSRLTRPLAPIELPPATVLEAITGDLVTRVGADVTMAARIEGHVPKSGRLVLAEVEPGPTGDGAPPRAIATLALKPELSEEGEARLQGTRYFAEPGRCRYRFEAGGAVTAWHNVSVHAVPQIKRISAHVAPAAAAQIKPYETEVEDYTLEVLRGSFVALTVEATERLGEATAKGPDSPLVSGPLRGSSEFEVRFQAAREGFIELSMTSAAGITNDQIPPVQVAIRVNEPPKFRLLSPDGDYMATNVASVPIAFEITDTLGLESASMHLEISDGPTETIPIQLEPGAREVTCEHVLEIEQYDLDVGDSILFYARATDLDAGAALEGQDATSEVYFIEIRPYRRRWYLPRQGPPPGGDMLHSLRDILEYTRAILKKTWAIAATRDQTDEANSRLDAISRDVTYCSEQLEALRLGPAWRLDDALRAIQQDYQEARTHLDAHEPDGAIPPEKSAYKKLRALVDELDMMQASGDEGDPQDEPERVKIEESVRLKAYDTERLTEALQQLADRLAQMAGEQKALGCEFEHFLEAARGKGPSQQVADAQPSAGNGEGESGAEGDSPGAARGSPTGVTVEGLQGASKTALPGPKGDGSGTGTGQSAGQGAGQGSAQGKAATATQRLGMLKARQQELQGRASQAHRTLTDLPASRDLGQAGARREALGHVAEAVGKMDEAQAGLGEAGQGREASGGQGQEAARALGQAARELEMASEALEGGLQASDEEKLAMEAQRWAREMQALADALEKSGTEAPGDAMARLQEAARMLETLAQQQAAGQGGQPDGQPSSPGQRAGGSGGTGGSGISAPSWQEVEEEPVAMARLLARKFWSIALMATRREARLVEEEVSDPEFSRLEREFFEEAARFDGRSH